VRGQQSKASPAGEAKRNPVSKKGAKPLTLRPVIRNGNAPRPQSLRDQAYDAIKHEIITCSLKPGEYINERLLSERLNFGRTPVHQAIDQLKHQGLIDVIPRKGLIVRALSLDEIMQVAEARMINETECARLAAARVTKAELAELKAILSRADRSRKSRDINALMELDRLFHGTLARAAKNPILSEVLRTLHERSLRVWFISLNDAEHLKRVQQEHEQIIEMLACGNAEGAANAMRQHIVSFRSNIARHVDGAISSHTVVST
jgi:GntR family transcriptional regulator, rspAB operon transcriptional repressor